MLALVQAMIMPPDGKPGQILVKKDGEWQWTWPSDDRLHRGANRFMLLVAAISISLLIGSFLLCMSARRAHSSELPNGMTCEQVVRAAAELNIPNTAWGRAQARIIALTYGMVLTSAQISAASQCLRSAK